MTKAEKISAIAVPAILLIAAGMILTLSAGSVTIAGYPLIALMIIYAFVVQWLAFIPAYWLQSERFFDLTGSLTYISLALITVIAHPHADARAWLVATLVVIWAVRLGSFLFSRIRQDGKDGRFDEIKPSFVRFFMVWTLQGLWVSLTALAALVVMSSPQSQPLGLMAAAGVLVWLVGMALEVVADHQKSLFKADPANHGRFIRSGLWAWSRHPNYAGEILLWSGVALIAVPVLQGWQWLALVSPVFVFALLRYVSGVPMLEKRSDARWGGQAEYEAYKAATPLLWPVPKALRSGAVKRVST